jgi:hypothetical protein
MGTIKATNIEPIADNGTVTLGSSGDTFTVPSGATLDLSNATQTGVGGVNTPALSVKLSSGQSIPNTATTKVQLNSKVIDTASAFDNSTNYRFTVPTGQDGTYNVSWQIGADDFTAVRFISFLYKNGSTFSESENFNSSNSFMHTGASLIIDLNAGDYLELYVYHNAGSTKNIRSSGSVYHTFLNAYKIIE